MSHECQLLRFVAHLHRYMMQCINVDFGNLSFTRFPSRDLYLVHISLIFLFDRFYI